MTKFYLWQFKKSVWWHRSRLAFGKYPIRSSVGYPARLMHSVVSVTISRRMSQKYIEYCRQLTINDQMCTAINTVQLEQRL